MTETAATAPRATDAAFRAAQDDSRTPEARIAAATAFEVLTLEEVAAAMPELVDAATLKARRAELVTKGGATLAIVGDLTERDAQRLILAAVRDAEHVVAQHEAAEARRAVRAAWAERGLVECSHCGGVGGARQWPGFTCYRCDGVGAVARS